MKNFALEDLQTEHLTNPLGIDCDSPRFAWKLVSEENHVLQTAYQVEIHTDGMEAANTGRVESAQSIEVTVPGWKPKPMTYYEVTVTVWDNKGNQAAIQGTLETGRMGVPFGGSWVEPVQEPTPNSWKGKNRNLTEGDPALQIEERREEDLKPAQYIRIPFEVKKKVRKARIYATAHGLYRLEVNGKRPDDREFAPENTSYLKLLQYQTYDVTDLINHEKNCIGVILSDGWWIGRVGLSGDSCQYGDRLGLLLEADIEYEDGTTDVITGENGVSHTGPIVRSDIFIGEKYDARLEMPGWSSRDFDDSGWPAVRRAEYTKDNIVAQKDAPVRAVRILKPEKILTTPAGETVLDVGQVLAGLISFTIDAPEGITITLEHSEVLSQEGNYYNNIIGVNKDQTDIYITRAGKQSYRPYFTYHGFRYVRITGWPGEISADAFTVYALTSEMKDIGVFETSDQRLNKLQQNIWWSQVSNTLSIPTDCPQRERAGWTGDIMAYAPTMCFLREADAFLTNWMGNVRADQLENGAVPMIVPYLKGYELFVKAGTGSDTSCGWGDAVLAVPYAVYRAYGDKRILSDNYEAMTKWLEYIRDRARNHHPEGYDTWDSEKKERDCYLWNTDFHFGDWLIPSVVNGNPDGTAMMNTAYATMGVVGPAYYAFSTDLMSRIAHALGYAEDEAYYKELNRRIREAFIAEYVHEDGCMDADFQGIYVIALHLGLVSDEIRPKMVARLCDMIHENHDCLDTGFLSVLFLMDTLCDNGRKDIAYKLLFQTRCPGWLYEVEQGATTMWESWAAMGENGEVSTYSYNHYAFGCVGEWMYRELGGLKMLEPAYKKIRIVPDFTCGLEWVRVSEETPYGTASIYWKKEGDKVNVEVDIPANTTAEIVLNQTGEPELVGSGHYEYRQPLVMD